MSNIEVTEQLNPIGFYYGDRSFYIGCAVLSPNYSASNPHFSATNDFLTYCPEFEKVLCGQNSYQGLVDRYIEQANHIFDYGLYGTDWFVVVSLYVAHWLYKTLQRVATVEEVPATASLSQMITALTSQQVGVVTEENLGGEVLKYENLLNVKGMENAGDYATTPYGVQLWTIARPYLKLFKMGRYGF